MHSITDIIESRRKFLLYSLAVGTLPALKGCATSEPVRVLGKPTELPAGQSIFRLAGNVLVNRKTASLDTPIQPGDVIETGSDEEIIFVLEKDAFMLRGASRLVLPKQTAAGQTLLLDKGNLLSVLASRKASIKTPSAVINIRGTGLYLEAEPDNTYACICYGSAELMTSDGSGDAELITSQHHDEPRYITAGTPNNASIQQAPFKNHTDEELLLLETLVGRTTPFIVPTGTRRVRKPYI